MIAVVIGFQLFASFFVTHLRSCSQFMDIFLKIGIDFFFTDSTDFCILVNHGNIPKVVQVAENTNLAELGDTCQQGKSDASVHGFQGSIESFQGAAVLVLQGFVPNSLEHGFVVFINENYHPAAGLLAGTADNALETERETRFTFTRAISAFPSA